LLTGNGSYAIDKEAMQHGAVDYLVKSDLNTEKIERCIRYSLGACGLYKSAEGQGKKVPAHF
jgi:ActR/RegA family two-component response regulator